MDVLSKSDPQIVLYMKNHEDIWKETGRTDKVSNDCNPVFAQPIQISYKFEERQDIRIRVFDLDDPGQSIGMADFLGELEIPVGQIVAVRSLTKPLDHPRFQECGTITITATEFSCYDHDDDGSHDFIGYFITTLAQLRDRANASTTVFDLINPKKLKTKKDYSNSGQVKMAECRVEKTYSFLDYIMGGLQLNCTVAIDFTGSNGDPQTPRSLHYIGAPEGNHYQQTWQAIGQIIQDYDADKLFPAFGFGAALPPHGQVSFEFALNGNADNPLCAGVPGVMESYKSSLLTVGLSGPTNCAPMMRNVSRLAIIAAQSRTAQHYYVLLILTDGQFTDIYDCIGAIVEASDYPMSIIIIGVGNANFEDMERLDADKKALQFNGRKASRDIVQFVPFKKYAGNSGALPGAVLAELPRQVEEYYRKRRITPLSKLDEESEEEDSCPSDSESEYSY
ncbi:copine-1-like [Bolinopsis microptera]|uniref:copine-1-like n=1 Tax=Bolinopsis microptera TaxID=2820187 RepID=UPI003078E87E